MNNLAQNQARREAHIRLGSTGSIYRLMQEFDLIASDTSLEIQQKCETYRITFETFQEKARTANGKDLTKLLDDLKEFEQACIQLKEKHTAQLNGLQHTTHSLWQRSVRFQNALQSFVGRKPRTDYDLYEISGMIQSVIDSYPPTRDSYKSQRTFIEQAKPVLIEARKDQVYLEKLWKSFVRAQAQAAETLRHLMMDLTAYRENYPLGWAWTERAYKNLFNDAHTIYKRLDHELERVLQQDINIHEAIARCQYIEAQASAELRPAITKVILIHEQNVEFQKTRLELEMSVEAKSPLKLDARSAELVRQFCSLAVRAEDQDMVKRLLELAHAILEQNIPREEAIRIINNQGLYIENQHVYKDSIVNNAGKSVSPESSEFYGRKPPAEEAQRRRDWGAELNHIRAEKVQFTAYHPKEGRVEEWHTLLVYTHLQSAAAAVERDFKRFQDQMKSPKTLISPAFAELFRGIEITIVPTCENVEFNPPSAGFKWMEDFHRIDFRFMADKSLSQDAARGRIDIYAGPFIIGCLTFAMLFTDKAVPQLLDCEEHATKLSKDDVFISYSRKDKLVAYAFKNVLEGSGFDVFLDVDDIRTGQYWQEEILRKIERAKIFQMFWSLNYSQSENCTLEWQHALKQNKEEGYIRPVYWNNPLSPIPPKELSKFNFKFVELKLPDSFL